MNKLQKTLSINAIFSSASGIILIFLHQQIATIFEVETTSVFWIIGCILIYFSITIAYEISKQRKLAIIWIIVQDYTWVIGSILLLVSNPFDISFLGNTIIATIALIVLYMGINQMVALKKHTSK